jgi:hypothetical protein
MTAFKNTPVFITQVLLASQRTTFRRHQAHETSRAAYPATHILQGKEMTLTKSEASPSGVLVSKIKLITYVEHWYSPFLDFSTRNPFL